MDLRDPRTFERVYSEHAQRALAAARRVLGDPDRAADAVHDVFLRVWREPDRFDARRGELGTYLALMARSRAIDLWRAEHARGRAADRLAVLEGGDRTSEDHPAEAAVRDAARTAVRTALRSLPPAQREAVVLAYWGGLTPREISERSGVPFGTVRSRIRLGLEKLAESGGDLAA